MASSSQQSQRLEITTAQHTSCSAWKDSRGIWALSPPWAAHWAVPRPAVSPAHCREQHPKLPPPALLLVPPQCTPVSGCTAGFEPIGRTGELQRAKAHRLRYAGSSWGAKTQGRMHKIQLQGHPQLTAPWRCQLAHQVTPEPSIAVISTSSPEQLKLQQGFWHMKCISNTH